MRYLDRAPVEGDRVHVEYNATVTKPIVAPHFWYGVRVNLPNGTPGETHVPRTATVRVIAPEPAVGDVVTADMDLPEGSIIEQTDDAFATMRLTKVTPTSELRWCGDGSRYQGLKRLLAQYDAYPWRIVRIGGAA